jgi:hypothetical protein
MTVFSEPASDFLDRRTGVFRTRRELSQRRLGAWFRKNRKAPQEQQKFLTFVKERHDASFRALCEQMRYCASGSEEIDSEAAEGVRVDFGRHLTGKNGLSFETLVEEFLQTQNDGP